LEGEEQKERDGGEEENEELGEIRGTGEIGETGETGETGKMGVIEVVGVVGEVEEEEMRRVQEREHEEARFRRGGGVVVVREARGSGNPERGNSKGGSWEGEVGLLELGIEDSAEPPPP